MKAIQIDRFGPAGAVTRVADVPEPAAPREEEITVAIAAAPINPSDMTYIEGRYFRPVSLPFCPGAEGLGFVIARGSAVHDLDAGDRVLMLTVGNWAQRRTVPARDVVKIGVDADPLQLAMLRVNPATAILLLENVVRLKPGDWVIQNAANSAVAALVIRFARDKGLRTVNLVRRAEAAVAVQQAGGEVVLVSGPELPQRVRQAIGEASIRLGLDAIAGEATGELAACMGLGGVIATYGTLSQEPCRVSANDLLARELSLVGFRLRGQRNDQSPRTLRALYTRLARSLASGGPFADIRATFAMDEIHAALRDAGRGPPGKVLLLPNGPVQLHSQPH